MRVRARVWVRMRVRVRIGGDPSYKCPCAGPPLSLRL